VARPGTEVVIRETPPVRSAPTDTGVWFVVGLAEKGPVDAAYKIDSLADFERIFGARVSYSFLYDSLETYFHEGGGSAYVVRIVGPAAVTAFKVLNDAGAAATLRVESKGPGPYGNNLRIAVLAGDAGGEFKLQVSHATLGILETSPSLADKTAAFAWAQNSSYIKLVDQASSNDPAVIAAQALAGGADDQAGITDATWETALGKMSRDLGPGQVSYPGRTTDQAHVDLLEHAAAYNRVAILDPPDTATKATLLTSVSGARTVNARYGAMFGPWIIIPGITAGTTRTVPPSALVAGLIGKQDSLGSANVPAAGVNGQAAFAIDLTQAAFLDADREELNGAGFNVIREMFGGVRVYGWRSLANPVTEVSWKFFNNVRMIMQIAAEAEAIAENFLFQEIDGQGRTIARFNGALVGLLTPFWTEGSLFGLTAGESFDVNTSSAVNTPETIANGELRAIIGVRLSPFGELVHIEIVKVPITEEVV